MKTYIIARISDTVLEDAYWPVDELCFDQGVVIEQRETVRHAAYALPDMTSWTYEQLAAWTRYDGTGTHPEVFHEVCVGRRWETFVTPETLRTTAATIAPTYA